MKLLLDTGILGQLCHVKPERNRIVAEWLARLLALDASRFWIFVPEIADYELRRKLLHLLAKGQVTPQALERLDELANLLDYLPLTTVTLRKAAELWAEARLQGFSTAPPHSLDADVILAAQAQLVGGTVVTTNRKHLSRFVPAMDWAEITP